MNRNLHKKYFPKCPRNIAVVDQYSWTNKDTNQYMCENGISHPIYDCNGWIQYSLPLEMYPPVNEIHPQIKMTKDLHLNWRDSHTRLNKLMEEEMSRNRGSSISRDNKSTERYEDVRLEGLYKDPYGY